MIPSVGTASGTLRMLDATLWQRVGTLVEELVEAVVAPYAVTAEVRYTQGVPPVVNTAPSVDSLRDAAHAAGLVPGTTVQSLGGEDFAWYLTEVRGAMGRLGTRSPGAPPTTCTRATWRSTSERRFGGKSPGRGGSGRRTAPRAGRARRSDSVTFPAR